MDLHQMLLENLAQEDVKYADYGISLNIDNADKNVFDPNMHIEFKDEEFQMIDFYNTSLLGVWNQDSYYFHNDEFKIVEGRNFTSEEIEKGSPVILIPKHSRHYTDKNKAEEIKVNDKVKFCIRLIKEDTDLPDIYKLENVLAYNEEFEKNIAYEKIIEVEVIGIYEDPEANKKIDSGIRIDYHVFAPLNFIHSLYEKEYEKIHELNDMGITLINDHLLRSDQYNYFELYDSKDISKFSEIMNAFVKKNNMKDYNLKVSNDDYLKAAGPLETVNSISKLILVAAITISLIILSCVSVLFLKDRKKEIGIMVSLGETQTRIMKQLMAEMLILGMIGISMSAITSPKLVSVMNQDIMQSYEKTSIDDETVVLPESLNQRSIMNKYEIELKNKSVIGALGISLTILIMSTGTSFLYLNRIKVKDILL